jgi:PAS domain S-box-containing protein
MKEKSGEQTEGRDQSVAENSVDENLPIDTSPLFKSILENSKEAAIFILDEKGTVLESNPGALQHFGYSPEDIKGKNFSVLFTPEDKDKSSPEIELKSVLETGSAKDNNYVVHKNGQHIWCHGESILAMDEKEKKFIVKIVYDIDEQKVLEHSLTSSNEQLSQTTEDLNLVNLDLSSKNEKLDRTIKDLDTFVYTASHDLKAPINNIEALVDALEQELDQGKNKEEIKEIIKMINKSIDKFKITIDDLATIGKVQAEGKNEDASEVSFQEILEDVKLNLKELIENAGSIFFVDFSNAPAVNFSPKNLRSVLQNLISNAIKYRSPLRRSEIQIISKKVDSYILLEVSDNGLGIKNEDKNKIFSMYKRLHTHVEGSGVGMTIVKRIVENNGGMIDVESEEGKGTTFRVYFKS